MLFNSQEQASHLFAASECNLFNCELSRYEIQVLRIAPWVLGYPMRRTRKFTILTRKDCFHWQGSSAEFEDIFSKRVVAPATEYFCEPQETVDTRFMKQARQKKKVPADGSKPDPKCLLTPAQRRRNSDAEAKNAEQHGAGQPYFTDIMHDNKHTSVGPNMPTILGNSIVYSSELGRVATPQELLAMQGVPMFNFMNEGVGLPKETADWLTVGASLSVSQMTLRAGLAVHRPCAASVVLYAMSRAVPRSKNMRFRNMGSILIDEEHGAEHGGSRGSADE